MSHRVGDRVEATGRPEPPSPQELGLDPCDPAAEIARQELELLDLGVPPDDQPPAFDDDAELAALAEGSPLL